MFSGIRRQTIRELRITILHRQYCYVQTLPVTQKFKLNQNPTFMDLFPLLFIICFVSFFLKL